MPELPEVEATKRSISPYLINDSIKTIIIRQDKLRYPISPQLKENCLEQTIQAISRRGKYLIFALNRGYLINHLGMSGHLRLVAPDKEVGKHDHLDLITSKGYCLRYHDPRRFGLWLYTETLINHFLFRHLGKEPLEHDFNAAYLIEKAANKQQPIKAFIMANEIVVGVGNIYATESLFLAGIHPQIKAGLVTASQLSLLAKTIKEVLTAAIVAGGTTLKDFYKADGSPGYFNQHLHVYGRKEAPCFQCGQAIKTLVIGGRTSFFCPCCQPN